MHQPAGHIGAEHTLTVVGQAGVESFAVIARSDGGLADSVEVLVHGPAAAAGLREAFQGRTKIVPQIRQASREEIETLQMPPQARKRRWFVDLR